VMVNLNPDTAQSDPAVLKMVVHLNQNCTGVLWDGDPSWHVGRWANRLFTIGGVNSGDHAVVSPTPILHQLIF